ncbi:MAG TPA: calcium-binding protein [Actinomycetota bacterium]|nr:calcium-binding protein [Actinomycetota bacterium]
MRTRTGRALLTTLAALIGAVAVQGPAAAAPRCFGKRATIVGTGGNDKINGRPGRDVIVGLGGHDRINGRAGDDLICGGGGRDFIRGKSGDDQLSGGAKRDVVFGQQGLDRVAGGGGSDFLTGNPGNDRIRAGAGGDFVLPGAGDDVAAGEGGPFDLVSFEGSPVGVIVDLNVTTPQNTNEGIDTLSGFEGVAGSAGNDRITGQNVPSQTGNGLFGGGGTDELLGLDGNDVVVGDEGNDRGGPGIGMVNGGAGSDIVIGGPGDDDLFGETGNDLLDGFEEAETVGDFGSGGPDTDECFGIETFDPIPANACETTARVAAGRLALWEEVPSSGWLTR